MTESKEETLQCTFCEKDANEVRKTICGPSVFICDECVDGCNEILFSKNPDHSALQKKRQMDAFVIQALGVDQDTCNTFLEKYRQISPQLQDALYTLLSSR